MGRSTSLRLLEHAQKIGARHSAGDVQAIQQILELAVSLLNDTDQQMVLEALVEHLGQEFANDTGKDFVPSDDILRLRVFGTVGRSGETTIPLEGDAVTVAVDAMVEALKAKLAETPDRVEKSIQARVKSIDEPKHRASMIISTPEIDRDKERILTSAFKSAKGKTYPLVNSHDYSSVINQLGTVTVTRISDTEVVADFDYLVGQGNKDADWAWNLAKRGLARASVGFMPKKYDDADLEDEKMVNAIMAGKEPLRTYTDLDLLETSQVIVGSNRGAVQQMVSKGLYTAEEGAQIEKMIDVVEKAPEKTPATTAPVSEKAKVTDVLEMFTGAPAVETKDGSWKVGGARGLPMSNDTSWDAAAAVASLDAYAGVDGEKPNWATYRRGFVVYDASEPEKKGSYRLPFARYENGRIVASKSGLQAVRQRLSSADIVDVESKAERFVDSYLGAQQDGVDQPPVRRSMKVNPYAGEADELAVLNAEGKTVWRGAPVDLEDLLTVPEKMVRVEINIAGESLLKALSTFTETFTSAMKEVTTGIQEALATLPTVPAHIADLPTAEDLAKAIGLVVTREARRIALEEVAKATGDVDTFLKH